MQRIPGEPTTRSEVAVSHATFGGGERAWPILRELMEEGADQDRPLEQVGTLLEELSAEGGGR